MSNSDNILERLKGRQPVISDPDELTDRIMDSLPDLEDLTPRKARVVSMRWCLAAAAASLLLLMGVGTTLFLKPDIQQGQVALMQYNDSTTGTNYQYKDSVLPVHRHSTISTKPTNKSKATTPKDTVVTPTKRQVPQKAVRIERKDPNLHYAALEANTDTIPYQDPARVDEFIEKFANYYQVKQGELKCSIPLDSSVVSAVYVFPDKKEVDVFGRLLQVACWYHNELPGYHLNFSRQQFFFELQDQHKQLQYRWIAERVNGRILLYSTCSPIEKKVSSACYQEYRDQLENKHIYPKTLSL